MRYDTLSVYNNRVIWFHGNCAKPNIMQRGHYSDNLLVMLSSLDLYSNPIEIQDFL